MDPRSDIDHFVARLRRRVRRAETAALLALFAAAAALAALPLLAATSLANDARGPRLVALLSAAGWLLSLVWCWWRVRRRWRDPTRLVALLGPEHAALRSDLLSTIQLSVAGPASGSPALVAALLRQTWAALRQLPAGALARPQRWQQAAVLGGLAVVTWATALAWQPGYWATAAHQLVDAVRAVPRLARQPVVGGVVLEYRYPTYMRRESVRVPDTTGDITAPPGTRVLVSAKSGIPTIDAALVVTSGDGARPLRRPLSLGAHGALAGVITVRDAARYHFELRANGTHALRDPVERRIEIEPDLSPKVALRGPPEAMAVSARQQLELGYSAEDDWGLTKVRLVYRVGSQAPASRPLWLHRGATAPVRNTAGTHSWDLGDLDVASATELRFWLEATDNDPVHGPKTTRSSVLRLTIFDREQQHGQTLAQQRQLLEQALVGLAARLTSAESGAQARPQRGQATTRGAPPALLKVESLDREQRLWTTALRALYQQMGRDSLVSAAVLRSVAAMVARWDALLRSAPTRGGPTLQAHHRRSIAALERDSLLLADLLDEQELQALGLAARELQADRARLAALIARWRVAPSAALRDRMLREFKRLERRAAQLLRTTNRLRARLPDEYLNAAAVERLAVVRDVEQLRRLFEARQLAGLDAQMTALEGKLEQLQRLLDGDVEQLRAARLDEREQAWHATLGQLHELRLQQERLAGATKSIVLSYRQRGAQSLGDQAAALITRQQVRAEQLRRHLRSATPQRLSSFHREELDRTLRWADWLRERLAARDLDQAAQLAERLAAGLEQIGTDLREDALGDEVPGWRDPQDHTVAQVERALDLAQQIAQDLEQALPRPATLLQEPERRRLRALAQQQRGLAKAASGLERPGAAEVAGDLLSGRGRELLGAAQRLMRDATTQLGKLEPQRAHGAQQGALQQLAELRQLLEEARRPGEAPSAGDERERVAIPGAEAFAPPPAFRRELLEAMQEPAPNSYSQQVKQYYRELIR
ncbi:MAG: DUF4175 family protein [Proteobacteria bacterium]|nr:DUF4175 family protein [Pseudomonadota bacterium]